MFSLSPAADDRAVVMLDMHNIIDAIHVSAGATLELLNITVSPTCALHQGRNYLTSERELRRIAWQTRSGPTLIYYATLCRSATLFTNCRSTCSSPTLLLQSASG